MAGNWATQKERGSKLAITITAWLYRILGRSLSLALISPIIFYFYLTGATQRKATREYLDRAFKAGYLKKTPGFWKGFQLYMNFAGAMVDRLGSWLGKFKVADLDGADADHFVEAKRAGGVVMTAHLGSPEVMRAVATVTGRFKINVLMQTENAEMYNAVMDSMSGDSTVRLIQVSEIGPDTALLLNEAVSKGEWVVLAADRRPAHDQGEAVAVEFLGDTAEFPLGPYILASLLKCPVYFLACVREGRGYRIIFETLAQRIKLPRGQRQEAAGDYAKSYAAKLENVVAQAPMQWFNFYDFWATSDVNRVDTQKADT